MLPICAATVTLIYGGMNIGPSGAPCGAPILWVPLFGGWGLHGCLNRLQSGALGSIESLKPLEQFLWCCGTGVGTYLVCTHD